MIRDILADNIHLKYKKVSTKGRNGKTRNVMFPETWSENAINITTQHYLQESEYSLKDMLCRISSGLLLRGENQSLMERLIEHQVFSFNSPMYYNLGINENPQLSACFILDIEDSIKGYTDLLAKEANIYKSGSGVGVNLSKLRPKNAPIKGGGTASGVVSFMSALDASAGIIKSGGKTRRAASMRELNIDHKDILEFVMSKSREEIKAHRNVQSGYSSSFIDPNGAYSSLKFQNANHSVMISDSFMSELDDNAESSTYYYQEDLYGEFSNKYITTDNFEVENNEQLWHKICEASHICGDPGVQFADNINNMSMIKYQETIEASNPCAEFVFANNTACNLASVNLIKFIDNEGNFDFESFDIVSRHIAIWMDIAIDIAGYPTEEIRNKTLKYRPLGLGFTNFGATVMRMGYAYGDKNCLEFASKIAQIQTFAVYHGNTKSLVGHQETKLDQANMDHVKEVLYKHAGDNPKFQQYVREIIAIGKLRNYHATVVAPTGTISFMLDCSTTGVEPEFSLKKNKQLITGEVVETVNLEILKTLQTLGYENAEDICSFALRTGTFCNSGIKNEHLAIFDCAMPCSFGRFIHYDLHLDVLIAIQPYISGAISKTVNLPYNTTIQEISNIYKRGWKSGLKCIALYRDNSKASQPLNSKIPCVHCDGDTIQTGACRTCISCGQTTSCG